jgi:hypothetical protein
MPMPRGLAPARIRRDMSTPSICSPYFTGSLVAAQISIA